MGTTPASTAVTTAAVIIAGATRAEAPTITITTVIITEAALDIPSRTAAVDSATLPLLLPAAAMRAAAVMPGAVDTAGAGAMAVVADITKAGCRPQGPLPPGAGRATLTGS
jgi:hypothetical protein